VIRRVLNRRFGGDIALPDDPQTLKSEEVIDLLLSLDSPGRRPDVLVADVKMPKLSGLGVLHALMQARWDLPVVMMTVVSDESIHTVAKRLGAVGVLHKPFDPSDLLTAVRNAKAARVLHR